MFRAILSGLAVFYGGAILLPMIVMLFVGGLVIGTPVYLLGKLPGFHQAEIAAGIAENENLMTAKALSVQWSTEEFSQKKTMTIKVTNNTGEAWGSFALACKTNRYEAPILDNSGILPHQTEIRTYTINFGASDTITSFQPDCTLTNHVRGKPTEWDSENYRVMRDGGWGDRTLEPVIQNGTI